jgi:hypothetical protein
VPTASKGSRHASAPSSDPTDAASRSKTRTASQTVSPPRHDQGSLPFTGWQLLQVVVLGLLSFALGLGLLRAVRRRGSRDTGDSTT